MKKILINQIQKKIGYIFNQPKILINALTHYNNNNEKLEFLGDSVLNYITTIYIYKNFPFINEGGMSKIRALLIQKNTLIKIAYKLNIKKYLKIKINKKKNNINKKIFFSNTIEAIIGGIFLDSNIKKTKKIIINWYKKYLNKKIFLNKKKDYKTKLQENLQSKKKLIPIYLIKYVYKKKNEKKFIIQCKIKNQFNITIGISNKKKNGEQKSAKKMLFFINKII